MHDPVASLSVINLFHHADIVVKGVLLLLLAASVWSWAVIIDKSWRLAAARRSVQAQEGRVAGRAFAAELMAPSGRPDRADPTARGDRRRLGREHRSAPRSRPKPRANAASGSSGRCGWC